MRPGLSGGATCWSSLKSPCRSCCSWAPGLFLRSWQQMLGVDPGFGGAPTAVLSVMDAGHGDRRRRASHATSARTLSGGARRRRRRARLAAAARVLLQLHRLHDRRSRAAPRPRGVPRRPSIVDGGFFDAAGMAIVDGRTFNDSDRRDSEPVAVISQAMARRYWPDGERAGPHPPPARSGRAQPGHRRRGKRHQHPIARGNTSRRHLPALYPG